MKLLFDAEKFIVEAVEKLRQDVKGKAIIAASGGVDSTVAAVLTYKAVTDQLTSVFVDTGFMRKGEAESVKAMFDRLGVDLTVVDASEEFYTGLAGITEPEQKRSVIGERFIRVFEREAETTQAKYLIQGTIAPDWIESGGGLRDTIKSHHNVGALPDDINMTLAEPLRDLYKDEVRQVARALNIEVAEKQPFPGPGLAVRILGEANQESAELVRECCAIVEEELESAASKEEMVLPWQYFAALLSVKSVGVQGDVRAYGRTVVVRAVQSLDGMTAAYSKIPHEVLERVSVRITNSLGSRINRVVYDITNKPPGTIEWE